MFQIIEGTSYKLSKNIHANPAQRRLAIWKEQERLGINPCFRTEHRFVCQNDSCPWRTECLGMVAQWLR